MLVSVTSEGGIASDGEIPRTWVIEEPSDDEKGRKGEPDKRSPVTLGADTLRLARHRGRPGSASGSPSGSAIARSGCSPSRSIEAAKMPHAVIRKRANDPTTPVLGRRPFLYH